MQEKYTSAQKSIRMCTASLILNDNFTLQNYEMGRAMFLFDWKKSCDIQVLIPNTWKRVFKSNAIH